MVAPRYLLDTSVYSQPLRRTPASAALIRWDEAGDDTCRISVVTRAEVEWGLLKSPQDRRDQMYRTILRDRLGMLPADQEVWRRFAVMKARQFRIGQPVGDLDLLIAATADLHQLVLASLNVSDFSRIEGLRWEDWSVAA